LTARFIRILGGYALHEENQLILAFHLQMDRSIVLGEEFAACEPMAATELRQGTKGTGHALRPWPAERLTLPRANSDSITGAKLG